MWARDLLRSTSRRRRHEGLLAKQSFCRKRAQRHFDRGGESVLDQDQRLAGDGGAVPETTFDAGIRLFDVVVEREKHDANLVGMW